MDSTLQRLRAVCAATAGQAASRPHGFMSFNILCVIVGVAAFVFVMESTWKLTPAVVEHSLPSSRRSAVVRYISDRSSFGICIINNRYYCC